MPGTRSKPDKMVESATVEAAENRMETNQELCKKGHVQFLFFKLKELYSGQIGHLFGWVGMVYL